MEPHINEADEAERRLDEDLREDGLRSLRHRNNELILDHIEVLKPLAGARLLDVGAAHGWFVHAAQQRGAEVLGLEPDEAVAARSDVGHLLRVGFFPDALDAGEQFDIITFNDVLEHLPRPDDALAECHARLSSGGLLVLNLPTTQGLLFRASLVADRVGLCSPLARLWQADLPSPHLWYFDASGLGDMARAHGFDEVHRSRLPAVSRHGIWGRVHSDRRASPLTLATVAAVLCGSGFLNSRWASDIGLSIFVRRPDRPLR